MGTIVDEMKQMEEEYLQRHSTFEVPLSPLRLLIEENSSRNGTKVASFLILRANTCDGYNEMN
jgi:hypothetical protein